MSIPWWGFMPLISAVFNFRRGEWGSINCIKMSNSPAVCIFQRVLAEYSEKISGNEDLLTQGAAKRGSERQGGIKGGKEWRRKEEMKTQKKGMKKGDMRMSVREKGPRENKKEGKYKGMRKAAEEKGGSC